jgi:hypothetical protein
MPYTPADPAHVPPLPRRARLVVPALVAGAAAPGVPYVAGVLVPGTARLGALTDRLPGALTVDLLLAAGLALLCSALREPLARLLPAPLGARLETLARTAPRPHPVWFTVSAALGALAHVEWDGLTGSGGPGRLLPLSGPGHPLFRYGGLLLALAALLWWSARLLRRTPPTPLPPAPGVAVVRALGVFSLLWAATPGPWTTSRRSCSTSPRPRPAGPPPTPPRCAPPH